MQYRLPIFENLCPSWGTILHLGVRRTFPKGSEIVDLVTPVNGVYFVKEGSVDVPLYTVHGPEKVLFYVGPGCIFGEISCFVGGGDEEASVRARTDCVLYFFSRDLIEGVIANQHPHLLIELIRASAYKIRMFSVLLHDSLNSNHFMRVCKMLVYLIRFKEVEIAEGQRQVIIQPEMTQLDMARLMGIHRVTVTKAISRLKTMGIINRFSKKALEINDFPALCRLIEEDAS
ncbi:MAG: Crp/Fnr family transcriptional regulator [Anaerolineales bacterium]|nr:Crp/Fnr family transcriptional regulator [Anaerolineales bacterium]